MKRKVGTMPAVCTGCYELIDLQWLGKQLVAKKFLIVHECGRVLVRGGLTVAGGEPHGNAVGVSTPSPHSPPASSLEKK